jgi:hypothetical protein
MENGLAEWLKWKFTCLVSLSPSVSIPYHTQKNKMLKNQKEEMILFTDNVSNKKIKLLRDFGKIEQYNIEA